MSDKRAFMIKSMVRRVFFDIEKHIEEVFSLKKNHSTYKDNAEEYSTKAQEYKVSVPKKIRPSLSYVLKEYEGLILEFRFEINWYFYGGLVITRRNEIQTKDKLQEFMPVVDVKELEEHINEEKFNYYKFSRSENWLEWRYFPDNDNNKNKALNFKSLEGVVLSLFESEEDYHRIMKKVFLRIDKYIEKFI